MDTEGMSVLLRGLVIGVSIAAPVGPIGLLCIRRALADGMAAGLATGLGAATADAVYGAIAGFGLAAVSALILDAQVPLRLVGGLLLLWLAWGTLRAAPAQAAARVDGGRGLAGAFASTFFLTLANPATIISFAAVFGALGVGSAGGGYAATAMVAGVFLGSALWWLILTAGVGLVRARVTPALMRWINRTSGAVLGGFGLAALASLVVGG